MAFRCYRVRRTWPPTINDFLSNAARGSPPRGPERTWPELHSGLSVYLTPERAADVARRLPFAQAIGELEIPDDAPVTIRKTLGPGHFTVWGDPDVLLGCVVREV